MCFSPVSYSLRIAHQGILNWPRERAGGLRREGRVFLLLLMLTNKISGITIVSTVTHCETLGDDVRETGWVLTSSRTLWAQSVVV